MSKPFDAATKRLVESQPAAWLEYAGLPSLEVEVIDTDVSTVTAAADKVLRVKEPDPWIAHLELQAGYESDFGERIHLYNAALRRRHHIPVLTIAFLLRREADGPEMSGQFYDRPPQGEGYTDFRYQVVRVWEKPVGEALAGRLATLPLAPLANVTREELPEIIRRMEERIEREASPGEAGDLWTATYVLMGLRYQRSLTQRLLKGVRAMKESVTYQAILEEGEAKGRVEGEANEARNLVLKLGRRRFGPPDAATQAKIEAIASVEEMERLAERLLEVENWEELLT